MTDGTLSLRRRDPKAAELAAQEAKKSVLSTGAYEYFADIESVFGTGHVKSAQQDGQQQGQPRQGAKAMAAVDEFRVENVRRKKLKDYDKFLKTFKYGAALDAVMVKVRRISTTFSCVGLIISPDCSTSNSIRSDPRIDFPRRLENSIGRPRRRDTGTDFKLPRSSYRRFEIRWYGSGSGGRPHW